MAGDDAAEEGKEGEGKAWTRDKIQTRLNASVLAVARRDGGGGEQQQQQQQDLWGNVVAVGLYQLRSEEGEAGGDGETKKQFRTGGLQLFRWGTGNEDRGRPESEAPGNPQQVHPHPGGRRFTPIGLGSPGGVEVIDTRSGIFEIKWFRRESPAARSVALAKAGGHVSVHRVVLERTEGGVVVGGEEEVASCSLTDDRDGVFCLCVDVGGAQGPGDAPGSASLAASTSDGLLHLLACDGPSIRPVCQWEAHALEPWAVCFDKRDPNLIFSGADDSVLQCWDARAAGPASDPLKVFARRGVHEAGVCCIRTHEAGGDHFLTSSYDERIRLWDRRNLARPVVAQEVETGGGVWRMDWCPSDPSLLLGACMHGGCKALEVDLAGGRLSPLAEYTAHESIAYGVGFLGETTARGGATRVEVASCSFYDNQLHGWEFEVPSSSDLA